MTDNDYVATATAEKRLREVLVERFDNAVDTQYLMDTLLNAADITYLPRKKSVSITLRIPETAPTPKPSNGKAADPEQLTSPNAQEREAMVGELAAGAERAREMFDQAEASLGQDKPRVARFGEFVPTVTSAPEHHEDDYFTE